MTVYQSLKRLLSWR